MVLHNYPLISLNSFGLKVTANRFITIKSLTDIASLGPLINKSGNKWLILGGGSNLLFRSDFGGLVIKVGMEGIERHDINRSESLITVGAGVVWDSFVEWAVSNGFGGTENLSLIPGETGAAAVQNIGAYGTEVSEIIEEVTLSEISSGKSIVLKNSDCRFGYRDSLFKREMKGSHMVTSVTFRLSRTAAINTAYGNLEEELSLLGDNSYAGIRKAVIKIRRSKLPDPDQIGNAGSFFKNPVIEKAKADHLAERFPGVPIYPVTDSKAKVAAGWLIDQCGWKGYRRGDAGVHEKQALVLVNYGSSVGEDIISLSEEIAASVEERFEITLEREVEIV